MRRVLVSTIVLGAVALAMSSVAPRTRADRFNLKSGCVNAECARRALRTGELPSPLNLANFNLQGTQTAPRFAGDANRSHGAALMISSFNSGGGSREGKGYTAPPASQVDLAVAVPEPTTLFLMGTGLISIAALLRRRLKARKPRLKA